jgi:hypothetical protein
MWLATAVGKRSASWACVNSIQTHPCESSQDMIVSMPQGPQAAQQRLHAPVHLDARLAGVQDRNLSVNGFHGKTPARTWRDVSRMRSHGGRTVRPSSGHGDGKDMAICFCQGGSPPAIRRRPAFLPSGNAEYVAEFERDDHPVYWRTPHTESSCPPPGGPGPDAAAGLTTRWRRGTPPGRVRAIEADPELAR